MVSHEKFKYAYAVNNPENLEHELEQIKLFSAISEDFEQRKAPKLLYKYIEVMYKYCTGVLHSHGYEKHPEDIENDDSFKISIEENPHAHKALMCIKYCNEIAPAITNKNNNTAMLYALKARDYYYGAYSHYINENSRRGALNLQGGKKGGREKAYSIASDKQDYLNDLKQFVCQSRQTNPKLNASRLAQLYLKNKPCCPYKEGTIRKHIGSLWASI